MYQNDTLHLYHQQQMYTMNNSKTLQNGQKVTYLSSSVFKATMKRVKVDTGLGLDVVGFSASLGGITINFYGEMESNYDVVIEEFAKKVNKKWVKCTPTDEQMEVMKIKMQKELIHIEEEYKRESTGRVFENKYGWAGANPNY